MSSSSCTSHPGLRKNLTGGDRRSIGRADAVAVRAANDPGLCAALVDLLSDRDSRVAMRAADALEKATRKRPDLLAPSKAVIVALLPHTGQAEVLWHLLQMLPRLPLTQEERHVLAPKVRASLSHPSCIVQAEAITSLSHLLDAEPALQEAWLQDLEGLARAGPPSVRVRARRCLAAMGGQRRASASAAAPTAKRRARASAGEEL